MVWQMFRTALVNIVQDEVDFSLTLSHFLMYDSMSGVCLGLRDYLCIVAIGPDVIYSIFVC